MQGWGGRGAGQWEEAEGTGWEAQWQMAQGVAGVVDSTGSWSSQRGVFSSQPASLSEAGDPGKER